VESEPVKASVPADDVPALVVVVVEVDVDVVVVDDG
jgi:hypothetical protein